MKLPTNAQINETVANAAEPIANPLPIAAVVLPTASSLSVMLRTSSGKWQLSARPPALSAIGPNASIETVVPTNDKQLTSNQLLFRAFIINSILYNIIEFAFMIFANKYVYLPSIMIFNLIQNILLIICGFMVMFRNDGKGLHDIICRTEVIKE